MFSNLMGQFVSYAWEMLAGKAYQTKSACGRVHGADYKVNLFQILNQADVTE